MHLAILTLVLALFFGADCLYFAGLVIGGEVIGMVLLMGGIIYLIGRLHSRAR